MQSPLRIIYTDTLTGESDHVDVIQGEFDLPGVVEAITREWGKMDLDWLFTLTPLHWVVDESGTTGCFIIRWDDHLLHGVCYTRFNLDHNPTK